MSNWGYTKYARTEFNNMYGVDPIELTTSDPLWAQWKAYRCNKITNFVRRVGIMCRYNNIMITTVIFPNRTLALNTKMQDWKTWSVNNFVDGFTNNINLTFVLLHPFSPPLYLPLIYFVTILE